MALSASASNIIVIWYLIASVLNILALGVLAYALIRVHTALSQLSTRVEPLLNKADTILEQANDHLEKAGTSASSILAHGENITATLQAQTEKTSAQVSRTIYRPFISVNALMSGVAEGAKTYLTLQKRQKQKGS
ncbi:MAG: hypothetical protein QM758_02240 [Armatimonas sp.]